MKSIRFAIGMLLVICISFIHIHCSLYTVENPMNPVTFIGLLMKGENTYFLFIGYTAQFFITLFAAYLILEFRHWMIWLLVYTIGALAVSWISKCNPLHDFSVFRNGEIAQRYNLFYRYEFPLLYATYYVILQFLVLFLYVSFTSMLRISFIRLSLNRTVSFAHHKYHIFVHSLFYENICRNKHVIGTTILLVVLLFLIIHIFLFKSA